MNLRTNIFRPNIIRLTAFAAVFALAQGAYAQSGGGTSYPNGITPDSAPNPAIPSEPELAKIPSGRSRIDVPSMSAYSFSPVQASTESAGIDLATGTTGFSVLAQAMTATGLFPTLRGPGPFTIFAPTDAAFARVDDGPLADLLAPRNRLRLQRVLAYHVVPQQINMDDIRGTMMYATMAGPPVLITHSANGSFTVNGANVVERDVVSANGNVDVIDSVLFPGGRGPRDAARDATH